MQLHLSPQLLGVRHATLGIRRENKGHWERRVPLTPDNVRVLVDQVCCAVTATICWWFIAEVCLMHL